MALVAKLSWDAGHVWFMLGTVVDLVKLACLQEDREIFLAAVLKQCGIEMSYSEHKGTAFFITSNHGHGTLVSYTFSDAGESTRVQMNSPVVGGNWFVISMDPFPKTHSCAGSYEAVAQRIGAEGRSLQLSMDQLGRQLSYV
eukprot:1771063-Amphidinium_carterae.2